MRFRRSKCVCGLLAGGARAAVGVVFADNLYNWQRNLPVALYDEDSFGRINLAYFYPSFMGANWLATKLTHSEKNRTKEASDFLAFYRSNEAAAIRRRGWYANDPAREDEHGGSAIRSH